MLQKNSNELFWPNWYYLGNYSYVGGYNHFIILIIIIANAILLKLFDGDSENKNISINDIYIL